MSHQLLSLNTRTHRAVLEKLGRVFDLFFTIETKAEVNCV